MVHSSYSSLVILNASELLADGVQQVNLLGWTPSASNSEAFGITRYSWRNVYSVLHG